MSNHQKGKGFSKSKWMKGDFLPYLEDNHPRAKTAYHQRLEREKQKKEESEFWISPPPSPVISWSLLTETIDETLSQLEESPNRNFEQDGQQWIELKKFRNIFNRLIRERINDEEEDRVYF